MTNTSLKPESEMDAALDLLYTLAADHASAVKNQVKLTNMLKAEARRWAGYDTLKSDDGMKLDPKASQRAYKRLITDRDDVAFNIRQQYIFDAIDAAKVEQRRCDREIAKVVERLPIADWVSRQRGVSASMVGKLLGEAGRDLSEYPNPAKLWKRFGYHVVNGKAPKATAGETLGFNPRRRAVAWNLCNGFIQQGCPETGWRRVYDERKQYEIDRATQAGKIVKPASQLTKVDKAAPGGFMTMGHVEARTRRYVVKKILEALWCQWTGNHREEWGLPEYLNKAA